MCSFFISRTSGTSRLPFRFGPSGSVLASRRTLPSVIRDVEGDTIRPVWSVPEIYINIGHTERTSGCVWSCGWPITPAVAAPWACAGQLGHCRCRPLCAAAAVRPCWPWPTTVLPGHRPSRARPNADVRERGPRRACRFFTPWLSTPGGCWVRLAALDTTSSVR